MQEESSQRTVALMVRAVLLTGEILKQAMMAYINEHNRQPLHNKDNEKHGKMSVKDLMGKDKGANTMDINNGNIRDFDRIAGKYNIDYAVKKIRSEQPPKYVVFFKGRDADVISRAFKDFCDLNEKRSKRPSLMATLEKFSERIPKPLTHERVREKHKEKEASL